MTVSPFAFADLESFRRADVEVERRLRRLAGDLGPRINAAWMALFSEPVQISLRRVDSIRPERAREDAIGIELGPVDDGDALLLEVEGALATRLVANVTKRPAVPIHLGSPAPPALVGATAAIALHLARQIGDGAPWRVHAAGGAASRARDFARARSGAATAWFTLVTAESAFDVRISGPSDPRWLPARPLPITPARWSAALGTVKLALPLVIASCVLRRDELDALAPGDVFAIGAPAREDGVVRPAALVAPRAETGLVVDLAPRGGLVIRDLFGSFPWDPPMSSSSSPSPASSSAPPTDRRDDAASAIDDLPIVVRVEMGAVEMSARAWAELAAGDVLTIGRAVGEPASLRVAGVEVARGDLVVVDGELGVRIRQSDRAEG